MILDHPVKGWVAEGYLTTLPNSEVKISSPSDYVSSLESNMEAPSIEGGFSLFCVQVSGGKLGHSGCGFQSSQTPPSILTFFSRCIVSS